MTIQKPQKTYYLDGASTTALSDKVVKAMQPYWQKDFGNPSSLYKSGLTAKKALTEARSKIANILSARPQEIIFTAGGTESINLAIFGAARHHQLSTGKVGHIISSAIEHDAVLKSLEALKEEGWKTSLAKVDKEGFVDLKNLQSLVKPDTVLISIMYANNEIGTVQPIIKISRWLAETNKQRVLKKLPRILLHTDACQAAGFLTLDVQKLGIDLMTVNGSKIHGPKQTGILYKKSSVALRPIMFGGGQESGFRSGTENVPGVIGFATALEEASNSRKQSKTIIKLQSLQQAFNDRLHKKVAKLRTLKLILNGPTLSKLSNTEKYLSRLPNNLNYTFTGIEGESLMIYLDAKGIYVSTGSACSTASNDPSHVLMAIGATTKQSQETLRISLYQELTIKDVDYIVSKIVESISIISS